MSRRVKHAPNTFDNYLMLHDKHLREREHFIEENGLSARYSDRLKQLRVEGLIRCQGRTYLKVSKTIQVRSDGWVETVKYAYHGGVSFPENRSIFRFDNAHGIHEQHVFDPVTGAEIGRPRMLTRDQWPHLSECLDMLEAWCIQYGSCADTEARKP